MSTTPQPIIRQKSLEEDLAEVTGGASVPQGKRMSLGGLRSLATLGEDIAFPSLGAGIGAAVGLPLGPGAFGTAAIGGMAGEAAKDVFRSLTGRVAEVGTPQEQVMRIGTSGLAAPLQEARAITGPAQRALTMTPQAAGAIEFGVDITKGQAVGGIRQRYESLLSKTLGGSGAFKKLGKQQAAQLEAGIEDFTSQISKQDLAPDEAGNLLIELIGETRDKIGKIVGEAESAITQKLPDLKIKNEGTISAKATELLSELKGPTKDFEALRQFGDFGKAIKLLEQFARVSKKGQESKLLDQFGRQLPAERIPIEKSVQNAIELKRLLQDAANFGEIGTKGEAALKRMAGTLRSEIESVVRKVDPKLADDLVKADEGFKEAIQRIDSRAIKQLLREDKPEVVLDILLRKGSKTRISRVEELIGPEEMKPIARSAVKKIFDDATNEGVLISQSFANLQKKIGPETINKLLGSPENVESFGRLSKLIDNLGLTAELTKPGSGGSAGIGLLQGAVSTAVGGAVAMKGESLAAGTLFGLGVAGLPAALAQMATRKGALVNLERILADSVAREGQKVAAQRLMGIVLAEKSRSEGRTLTRQEEVPTRKRF